MTLVRIILLINALVFGLRVHEGSGIDPNGGGAMDPNGENRLTSAGCRGDYTACIDPNG